MHDMLRNTISTIRKVFVFTYFVPQIWRGHVKQVAKEKLPGLLSTAQKSSNSDSQDEKERCKKCMRIINYSFGEGEYSAADITSFKVDTEQIAITASQLHTKSDLSKEQNDQKNSIETILNTTFDKENKDGQKYTERQACYSTTDKSTEHTDKPQEKNRIEKLDEPSVVVKPEEQWGGEPHILNGPYLKNSGKPLKDVDKSKVADVAEPYFPYRKKVMTLYPHSNVGGVTSLFDCSHPAVERRGETSPTAMIDKELFDEVESQTLPPNLHQWSSQTDQNNTGERPRHPTENTDNDLSTPQTQCQYQKENIHPAFFFYSPISGKPNVNVASEAADKGAFHCSKQTVTVEPKIRNLNVESANQNFMIGVTKTNEITSRKHEAAKPFLTNTKPLDYEASLKDSIKDKTTPPQESDLVFQNNATEINKAEIFKSEQETHRIKDYPKIIEDGPVIYSETSCYPLRRNDPVLDSCTDTNAAMNNLSTLQEPFSEQIIPPEAIKQITEPEQSLKIKENNDKKQTRDNVDAAGESEAMIELMEQKSQFVKPEMIEEIETPAIDKEIQNQKSAIAEKPETIEELDKPLVEKDRNQEPVIIEELEKPEMDKEIQNPKSAIAENLERPEIIEEFDKSMVKEVQIQKTAIIENFEKPSAVEEVQKPALDEPVQMPTKEVQMNTQTAELIEDIQTTPLNPATVEEVQVNTKVQEAPQTEADESSVLNSYSPPTSEKIQTNISANVGPLPLISHADIETMRLSEILRLVQTRNRLEACKAYEVRSTSMAEKKAMSKCPKSPCCPPPPPCCPPPPCPPPPPPSCPPPKPPNCPPPPPPCPPTPPPCPPPPACPPPCPKPAPCPPKKKDPCRPKKKTCCVGYTEDIKSKLPRLILRALSSILITRRDVPATAVTEIGVLQPINEEISSNSVSILFARDFEPWTPIPSWPVPVKTRKRVVLCPKDGCPFPKPPKDGEFCKPREKPCKGFPRRLTCLGIIDPFVLDSVWKYAYNVNDF